MERDTVAPDRDSLAWCLRQPNVPYHKLIALRPDFFVISPPKTASTWLAANLRRHPELFVPAIKEIRYFSTHFDRLDLSWYLDQFAPGAGLVKGEASPSYAALPRQRLRLIRRLMPDVKLICVLRDPVSRAWSYAKHHFRFRDATFASCTTEFPGVTDGQWREHFLRAWSLACSDYLGQLRRWLSVFPREQFHVAFFESIVDRPQTLLRDIFAFLGVTPDVDFSAYLLSEKVFPGLPEKLPSSLQPFLQHLLAGQTREFASLLREEFGLQLPPEWQGSLGPVSAGLGQSPFAHELDDRFLLRALDQEATLVSPPYLIQQGYWGFNIVLYRGRLYAVDQQLGPLCLDTLGEAKLRQHQQSGACLVAPSLAEVKELVTQHVMGRMQANLRIIDSLQADLCDAHARIAGLERGLVGARRELVASLNPLYLLAKVVRKLCGWLRAWLNGKVFAGSASLLAIVENEGRTASVTAPHAGKETGVG